MPNQTAPWLSPLLGASPTPGLITWTETFNFTDNQGIDNKDADFYDHEVRAYWGAKWVVQRDQEALGNCGIIASIEAVEAALGNYVGPTDYWLTYAINNGLAISSTDPTQEGGMGAQSCAALCSDMGGAQVSVQIMQITSNNPLSALATYISEGEVICPIKPYYAPDLQAGDSPNAGHFSTGLGRIATNRRIYGHYDRLEPAIRSFGDRASCGYAPASAESV